jgi:hypothetical protein
MVVTQFLPGLIIHASGAFAMGLAEAKEGALDELSSLRNFLIGYAPLFVMLYTSIGVTLREKFVRCTKKISWCFPFELLHRLAEKVVVGPLQSVLVPPITCVVFFAPLVLANRRDQECILPRRISLYSEAIAGRVRVLPPRINP